MRIRSSLLGAELHADREPEVSGARITIQGTFPPEELFPAFVLCVPERCALICPENEGDAYFLVRDGVLYEQGAMEEVVLCGTDGQRGESKGLDQVLPDTVRESASVDEATALAQIRAFTNAAGMDYWRSHISYTEGGEQDTSIPPYYLCDGRGRLLARSGGVLQRSASSSEPDHSNLIGRTGLVW